MLRFAFIDTNPPTHLAATPSLFRVLQQNFTTPESEPQPFPGCPSVLFLSLLKMYLLFFGFSFTFEIMMQLYYFSLPLYPS